jgi:uncharacterized C2H2 Zn-finger protein
MVNCPKCGKEFRHKGALNGHLAFAHGVITPRQLKLDELRSEVKRLQSEMEDLKRRLERLESVAWTGKHTYYHSACKPIERCTSKLRPIELHS